MAAVITVIYEKKYIAIDGKNKLHQPLMEKQGVFGCMGHLLVYLFQDCPPT